MGWIAESLGLDYLRVRDCRCKGRSHARIFDTEIGYEDASAWDLPKRHESDDEDASTSNLSETGDGDASTSNWTKRREACMSVTNTLRRRFLQAGPEDSVQCLSIPKTLLRLW
jgi:hypothetical protein